MDKRLIRAGLIACLVILSMIAVGSSAYGDDAAFGALACLGGTLCILPIIWIVIAIALAVWVYRDAESRGESGVLWLIICALLGIIGFIIWLLVRPKEKKPESGQKTV